MAKPITKKSLKELPDYRYEKIREYLKTGQIVFCSGSYAFSGIIQKLTKSTWSHVAVIYKDEELGRVLVLGSRAPIWYPLNSAFKIFKRLQRNQTSL